MLTAARKLSVTRFGPRTVSAAVLVAAVAIVGALLAWRLDTGEARAARIVTPDPLSMDVRQVRPLSRESAAAINARVPAEGRVPAASPFAAAFAAAEERSRALHCLTQAIYYEAANEPDGGQLAVAQVVLNRVRHPSFPDSICGVVYQGSTRRTGCQFTFTCDGSLGRRPSTSGWARARRAAESALAGAVFAPVGTSTHYHANYVVPYWASSLVKTAAVGAHIFYRWRGGAGRAGAFTDRYAGLEPVVSGRTAPAEAKAPETDVAELPPEALANPALVPLASAIPEARAEEMDRFGLLDYRRPAPAAASMGSDDHRIEDAVVAATSRARRASLPAAPATPAS